MARYDNLRKIKRNENLREYARQHPELSQKEIGEYFNITPSRVSRLLSGKKAKHG